MSRKLLVLGLGVIFWASLGVAEAHAWGWYDGSPGAPWWEFDTRLPGGILYIQQPGMSICSVGGVFLPRKVTVTETNGPVPITSTFVYPSAFHSPTSLLNLKFGRGMVKVQVPDERGLLYVNGDPTPLRGSVQYLTTPLLQVDQVHVYHLRAAFRSGEKLLIQDGTVQVHAGQAVPFTFDGTKAVAVRLPVKADVPETAPVPRQLQDGPVR